MVRTYEDSKELKKLNQLQYATFSAGDATGWGWKAEIARYTGSLAELS
jgi:hypothetical protein